MKLKHFPQIFGRYFHPHHNSHVANVHIVIQQYCDRKRESKLKIAKKDYEKLNKCNYNVEIR